MLNRMKVVVAQEGLTRELGQGVLLLGLVGSMVGGFMGFVAIATQALGR